MIAKSKPRQFARTQQEIADHFGVHRRTVADWCRLPGFPSRTKRGWNLAKVDQWRADRYGTPDEADPLLSGPDTAALERYRLARAKREEFALERDRGNWVRREDVHAGIAIFATVLRQACDTLHKQFGRDAHSILAEAVNDAVRAFNRQLGEGGTALGSQADPTATNPDNAGVRGIGDHAS